MKRILVGVDGSSSSCQALGWAAYVAERAGLELTATRVFVPTQAELPPDEYDALHEEQLRELDEWCVALRTGDSHTRTLLVDGEPADALLFTASEEGADMVVVGGRGTGGFLHLHPGSVAHRLAHHSTIPLAVVPANGAFPTEHVVVGVDGSRASLAAADFSAEFASSLDVPVTAVYAFEPFVEWVPESDSRSWHRQAEADVRTWTAPVRQTGVELHVDVERSLHPVAVIDRAIASHPGSVAVVGSRALRSGLDARLGHVAFHVAHDTGAIAILVPAISTESKLHA